MKRKLAEIQPLLDAAVKPRALRALESAVGRRPPLLLEGTLVLLTYYYYYATRRPLYARHYYSMLHTDMPCTVHVWTF